nr:reverse transcriptase domain-containing protein [Tanacetum cinerariifolium]
MIKTKLFPGSDAKNLMRSSYDFNKKFYNSLGRVPDRCSSRIGKTRGLLSLSKGIGPLQVEYIIREIHKGSCSMHSGPRSMVTKAVRAGKAAIQEAKSKAKMEKYYNAKVRCTTFKLGDFVYHRNEANHTKEGGKLGPKCKGPHEIVEALEKGAYKIRNDNRDILPRTWNVKDQKKYYL